MQVDGASRAPFLAIATTVKAPIEAIREFLDHHLAIGVDRIYLFVDDGDAETEIELERAYGDAVHVTGCMDTYWRTAHDQERPAAVEVRQKLNATAALVRARHDGVAWLAHMDVDEYMHFEGCVPEVVLRAMPKNVDVVRLRVYEATVDTVGRQRPQDVRVFRSLPLPIAMDDLRYSLADRLGAAIRTFACRAWFLLAGRILRRPGLPSSMYDYFNAHYIGKSVCRVSDSVVGWGLHLPTFAEGARVRIVCPRRCTMLHFDSCTFDQWKSKWSRRLTRAGLAAGLDRRQIEIMNLFRSTSGDEAAQRELYRHLYVVSPAATRWLEPIGMLRRASSALTKSRTRAEP